MTVPRVPGPVAAFIATIAVVVAPGTAGEVAVVAMPFTPAAAVGAAMPGAAHDAAETVASGAKDVPAGTAVPGVATGVGSGTTTLATPVHRGARAVPGRAFELPRDHFGHPEFESEWWYYTGNLFTASGRHFGFELTFFRRARAVDAAQPSAWDLDQVYLAHFTIADTHAGRFLVEERLNRAGPGIAGADVRMRRIWNGNWSVVWRPGDETRPVQVLTAMHRDAVLHLVLEPRKPVVVHGHDGVSRKVAGDPQAASHYLSFTRMAATGTVAIEGETHAVTGRAWMDHEFFSDYLAPHKAGWDWMSVQLDDGADLMLFGIRDTEGGYGPDTFGTFVDAGGRAHPIGSGGVELRPGRRWRSEATGARYPVEWRVEVPHLDLWLAVRPRLDAQEVFTGRGILPAYWEGAVRYAGERRGRPVTGVGYLEMTGYAGRLDIDGIGEAARAQSMPTDPHPQP